MPLYEYQCRKCGHRFEVIQKFSDPPRTKCPECRGKVDKLLSPPAIQFKGSGWYVTDYGGKKGKEETAPKPSGDKGTEKTKDKPKTKSGPDKKS